MSQWEPQLAQLNDLVLALARYQNPYEDHAALYKIFQDFNKIPDYNNYLAYIFANLHDPNQQQERIAAGIQIKNNVDNYFGMLSRDFQQYIKAAVISCLADKDQKVRQTSANILASIFRLDVSHRDICSQFPSFLKTENLFLIDGTLLTLSNICEDYKSEASIIQKEDSFLLVIPELTPLLLLFFVSPHEVLRYHALQSIYHLFFFSSGCLSNNIDLFLRNLFLLLEIENGRDLSQPLSIEIKTSLSHMIAYLSDTHYLSRFIDRIDFVFTFVFACIGSGNEPLATAACDFWTTFAQQENYTEILDRLLPKLLPILLDGMMFSEDERASLQVEETNDDHLIPDKDQQLKPSHSKVKRTPSSVTEEGNGVREEDGNSDSEDEDDEEEEDDDDDDYGLNFGGSSGKWNLRKTSALALDIISHRLQSHTIQLIFALLPQRFSNPQWFVREAAILAIGAIAQGCKNELSSEMYNLSEFLYRILSNDQEKPMVQSMAMWSLSRFNHWHSQSDESVRKYLSAIGYCIQSKSKKVQQAGCSALLTVYEETQINFLSQTPHLVQNLAWAVRHYQAANRLALYDAIGSIVDNSDSILLQNNELYSHFEQHVLVPLLERWWRIEETDRAFLPLSGCLSSVVSIIKQRFEPFSLKFFQKSLSILEKWMVLGSQTQLDCDPDVAVYTLDSISALCDGLQSNISDLVGSTNILPIVMELTKKSHSHTVRQASFAALGDLVKNSPYHFRERFQQVSTVIINSLEPLSSSVTNNACWFLCESLKWLKDCFVNAQQSDHLLERILESLVKISQLKFVSEGIKENIAVALTFIAEADTKLVVHHLAMYIHSWCWYTEQIKNEREKERAGHWISECVLLNPEHALPKFNFVIVMIASFPHPSPELTAKFYDMLHKFKKATPQDRWEEFIAKALNNQARETIRQLYQL